MFACAAFALALQQSEFTVFDGWSSLSGKYAVAWREVVPPPTDGSPDTENHLWDAESARPLFKLKGIGHFPNENHGSLTVRYSDDEKFVAVLHGGKWEPRGFTLADTKVGSQTNALTVVRKQTAAWFKRNERAAYAKYAAHMVYDVSELEYADTELTVKVIAQRPKEDEFGFTVRERYRVSLGKSGPKMTYLGAEREPDAW